VKSSNKKLVGFHSLNFSFQVSGFIPHPSIPLSTLNHPKQHDPNRRGDVLKVDADEDGVAGGGRRPRGGRAAVSGSDEAADNFAEEIEGG